ncbi:hypothetical protein LPJ61_004798, partial [Coemansia biformis]
MPGRRAAVPLGVNVDTAVGLVDAAFSAPLCAAFIVAAAYLRSMLSSPWLAVYVLAFLARSCAAWKSRLCEAEKIDWRQQVVVLTGGAHGIGLGLLRRLGTTGARVAVLDIVAVPDPMPANAIYCRCDLADSAQLTAALARVEVELGTATILINNAGTLSPCLVAELSASEIDRVVNANLVAPMKLTQHLLPGMLQCEHAHIVFVSSALAFIGIPRLATYTASKAGLAMFYESLKLELRHWLQARHVKATIIFPSKVQTGLFDGIRMPEWLSPELASETVVDAIFSALDHAQGGEVYMPVFANIAPLYMLIPPMLRDIANDAVAVAMSDTDFVDLTLDGSDDGLHFIHDDDDDDSLHLVHGDDGLHFIHDNDRDGVYIVDVKPPNKKIKLEGRRGGDSDGDSSNSSGVPVESIAAPTSAYSEIAGIPSTLMVLTEGRGVASEIAYCLVNLATSQCTLSQFADGASYSRTIYALITSRPQVVLVPRAMADGKSKAMHSIRRYLPWLTVVPMERKRFSDTGGVAVLQNIALPSQVVQLTRALHTKYANVRTRHVRYTCAGECECPGEPANHTQSDPYRRTRQYAYAALNATFCYLEHDLEVVVASNSISVSCKQMEGVMQIDPGAWRDLGLEYSSDGKDSRKGDRSLLQAIDHTHTRMGGRLLRSNILQPLTDLSTIYARQGAVLEILDHEELFFFLSARLAEIPDIDATIASLVRLPVAASSRQANQVISNVLHVKHILQLAAFLAGSFASGPESALLGSIVGVLADPRNDDLLQHIHSVVREDITFEKSAQMTRSQRCHAVKVQ